MDESRNIKRLALVLFVSFFSSPSCVDEENNSEPSCSDEIMNQDETGVDCGGSCPPCRDGRGEYGDECNADWDCFTGNCEGTRCGHPVDHLDLGGTVVGLNGTGLIIQNNTHHYLEIFENGEFVFQNQMSKGMQYEITILSHPKKQVCSVRKGTGTGIFSYFSINDIEIYCEDSIDIEQHRL